MNFVTRPSHPSQFEQRQVRLAKYQLHHQHVMMCDVGYM